MKMLNGQVGANRMVSQYIEAQPSREGREFIMKQLEKWTEAIRDDLKKNRKAAVQAIYRAADMVIKEANHVNSCKRGCNFCCRMNVDIMIEEAEFIGEYCNRNKIPISRKYLEEQLQVSREEIGFHPAIAACVFLKNGECSIYAARPLNCRKYLVASPAEDCDVKYAGIRKIAIICDISVEILDSAFMSASSSDSFLRLPKALLPYSK